MMRKEKGETHLQYLVCNMYMLEPPCNPQYAHLKLAVAGFWLNDQTVTSVRLT